MQTFSTHISRFWSRFWAWSDRILARRDPAAGTISATPPAFHKNWLRRRRKRWGG
jgi:hypothetical protein